MKFFNPFHLSIISSSHLTMLRLVIELKHHPIFDKALRFFVEALKTTTFALFLCLLALGMSRLEKLFE